MNCFVHKILKMCTSEPIKYKIMENKILSKMEDWHMEIWDTDIDHMDLYVFLW